MKTLEENRRSVIREEEGESGTIQEDNDHTQAIDEWIEFLDDLKRIEEDKKRSKEEKDSEKQAVVDARDQLLLGLKRRRRSTTTIDDDIDDGRSTPSSSSITQKRHRKEPRTSVIHKFEDDSMITKQDWIEIMEAQGSIDNSRLEVVEKEVKEVSEEVKEVRTITNEIRSVVERLERLLTGSFRI